MIQQEVSDSLDWDKELGPYDIRVRVHDRLVRLAGVVRAPAERRRAVRITERTKDVIGVVNGLRVEPGVTAASGKRLALPKDSTLRARVLQTLARHRDLDADGISVTVRQGQVVLSGQVPDLTQRQLANRITSSLYGVRGVKNDLKATSP
ncbi:MAG: BON domain-containing protein [Chromatiaceae bacterium]